MSRGIFSHIKDKTDTMAAYLPYESVYYEKIADYYKVIRYAMLVLLAAFVLIVGIFCNKDLRAENFRYLFKYIDVDPVASSANYSDIYYDTNENTVFALYKGDLAVVGDGKLKLYNIAGRNILDEKLETENALCDSAGKYLVMYYPGEKSVSIFNSFSKLYSIEYDYPVMYASAGENGSFAVITRDESYRSAVYIYNSSFKSAYTWRSNEKYAVSAAVSSNGKNAAVLSYSQSGGTYLREITVRNISKDKQMLSVATEGAMPIKIGFFGNDNLYSLCADGLTFYNDDFEKITEVAFDDEIQFYRTFSDGVVVLTGKTKADTVVHYYDSQGNKKLTKNFRYSVLDINVIDDIIYLLTDSAVYRCENGVLSSAEIQSGADAMFLFDDGNVLICYDDSTQLVDKSNFEKVD